MKLPLNLKKFKKISEDDSHTTLKHYEGHEIKIAHKALSKDNREALKGMKLANGGEVDIDKKKAAAFSKGVNEGSEGVLGKAVKGFFGMTPTPAPDQKAHGGQLVAKYADGGDVSQDDETASQSIPINVTNPYQAQAIPENMANPNPGAQAMAQNPPIQQAPAPLQDIYGVPKEEQAKMQMAQMQGGQAPQQSEAQSMAPQSNAAMSENPGAPQAQQDPYGAQKAMDTFDQGLNNTKAGIGLEGAAQAQVGQQEAHALQQQIGAQQQVAHNYQSHYNDLENERQAFQHDIQNQNIDPNHYMHSKSTASNISTGIGLILGGMGSAVTGGENPALSFLNKQIDRDIDAQKANLGKSESLLSANMRQFGNLRDATDMTRVMNNDIVSMKLKKAAADAATPMAAAQALKAAGQLDMSSSQMQGQMAMRRTMLQHMGDASGAQGSQQQDAQVGAQIQMYRMMGMEPQAKALEERYVPNVGMSASVPVPKEAREALQAKQTMASMAKDFYKWSEAHSGSLDPSQVAIGRTKAAELQSLYRNSINGGVFKKGEQEFIDQIVDSDPTKFFNSIRVLPKLKEVIDNNDQQFNMLKKQYSITSPQGAKIQEAPPVQIKK